MLSVFCANRDRLTLASRSGAGAAAAAPSATGIVSEAQAQHLDSLARSAQSDVDKATADLREEQGMVKKVQARAKYLQVRKSWML